MPRIIPLIVIVWAAAGCVPTYTLIAPTTVGVAGDNLRVTPGIAWNKAPKNADSIPEGELWTLNGLSLDSVAFIGGLADGEAMAKQKDKDDRQVPPFRANMTPPELMSMVESYYRIKAGASVFDTTSVEPVTFLGRPGMQMEYDFIGGDDVKRRGRTVLAVVDERLFLMSLNAARLHYFDAALPDFEGMVGSARLP